MLVIESNANRILSRLFDNVADVARAVFSVFEFNLGFGRPLDSNGEASVTSLSGPDVEVGRLALHTTLKTRSSGMNPVSTAVLQGSNSKLEWRSRNVHIAIHHTYGVHSKFIWHKIDGIKAVLELGNKCIFNLSNTDEYIN